MAARIGDRGRAACPLYPSGRVFIGAAPMAARAESGPIEEGAEIVVVGGDRFSLVVRPFDGAFTVESLERFGEPVLTAKEEAALQASVAMENRRIEQEEHRQTFWRLTRMAAWGGFAIGVCQLIVELSHAGYSPSSLLWIPPLSAVCWCSLVVLAFCLGAATESISFFLSIPFALLALIVGTIWGGPFIAISFCFVTGTIVILGSLVIEAMRHPIQE